MKRFNLSGPQDIMALLVRRKWWFVLPFIALSCAAVLMAWILPRMYVSTSLVRITPRDLSKDFVKDLVSGSTAQRVSTIQQTVLSRTNLNSILDDFKNDFPDLQKLDIEERANKLRDKIDVKFDVNTVGREEIPLTYFHISYQNRNAALAQKITTKLTDLFIREDNKTRETQVNGQVSFLKDGVEDLARRLKESDTKLRDLKESKGNSLPNLLLTTMAGLETLKAQRRQDANARDSVQSDLAGVNTQLAVTPQYIPKPPTPVIAPPTIIENPKITDYKKALKELEDLRAKYTENFPPVILARERVDKLKKELTTEDLANLNRKEEKPAQTTPAAETILNPAYQGLLTLQEKYKKDLEGKERNLKETDDSIAKQMQVLQQAPKSEQDIAEVARENVDLNIQYSKLKNDLATAQLSESAETSEKGSQFKVIDAANFPVSPTKPSKSVLAGAGVMVSLLIGLALGLLVDIANQKMWTLSDIETILGATVLVEIPEIVTAADVAAVRRKKIKQLVSGFVIASVYGVCLYLVYLHQAFVLKTLDPLIQRFY